MIPLHQNPKSGRQYAVLKGQRGQRAIKISLGTKSRAVAKKLVRDAGLADIQHAAKANALTAEVVTRLKAGKRVSVNFAFQDYLESLPVRGRRQSSIEHDRRVLTHWIESEKLGSLPIAIVDDKHVHRFVNVRKDTKYATRYRQLTTVRTFLRFCFDRGWIASNPASQVVVQIDGLKQDQLLEEEKIPMTEADVRKILAQLPADEFWHAATLIGWHTGLRLGDVATLDWASISEDRIRVTTSKGVRLVDMELSPELKRLFSRWPRTASRFVFPQQAAMALDASTALSQWYGRMCRRLGLEGKSFNSLRHGFAMRSMDTVSEKKLKLVQEMIGAASLDEVRQLLGHAKSKVTLRYLSHPKQ